MSDHYDTIGIHYDELRVPDPRIATQIFDALGSARRVVNIGAGTGSYEPVDRDVIAVEPSRLMIEKRHNEAAPVVQASAEALPFDNKAFDAAMAVLTVHHWQDPAAGFAEMRRVTRGPIVVLTYDPDARPWLVDYLPELAALDEAQMPALDRFEDWLGGISIEPIPIPDDCTDGFLHAYWRRPEAYLDARIRSGISSFWALDNLADGLTQLRRDLDTGAWAQRYASLLQTRRYDAGYRLIVADGR
ncbi:MAG: class I SAM-dependent methyltransferase [Pseudomonadota bacterium]